MTATTDQFNTYVAAVKAAGGIVTNWPFAGGWDLFGSLWSDDDDTVLVPFGSVAVDSLRNIVAVRFDNATYTRNANNGTLATLGLLGQPQRPANSGAYMYIMAPSSLNVGSSVPDLSGEYHSTVDGGLDNPNPAPSWYLSLVNGLKQTGVLIGVGVLGYLLVTRSKGPREFE